MQKRDSNIDIYALTDCHQEARKLCNLFSGIVRRAADNGNNTLICDGGDLFKGIYDRELCVESYLKLRQLLPQAKIAIALGNNDFGFDLDSFNFLVQSARRFNQANIHLLCANVVELESGKYPSWVDPYILLEINHKKVLVTAFCYNPVKVQRYGVKMLDITQAFMQMEETIKHIAPDALVVLNHALLPSSLEIYEAAQKCGIDIDLLIGGHEHSVVEPDEKRRIYYPQAFSRTMLHFNMDLSTRPTKLKFMETINSKLEPINPFFAEPIEKFEEEAGLNIPIAKSTLNLTRHYSNPCPLGTFVADQMRAAAGTSIAMISTGYMSHALRYEKDKVLTMYNLERSFSAETPLQTVELNADDLKNVLNNALRLYYTQHSGNTRFLQCSQNLCIVCSPNETMAAEVRQIIINGVELLDEHGNARHPEELISCAIDTFIGSGELDFDVMRSLGKETLMRDNQLVRIKDLFINGIKEAESKYAPGSEYPVFKLIDLAK